MNVLLTLNDNAIGSTTGGYVEVGRRKRPADPMWQANQRFELVFTSPYSDPAIYHSFTDANPPACIVSSRPIQIYELPARSPNF